MKHPAQKIWIVLLALLLQVLSISASYADSYIVCEVDLVNKVSKFSWQEVQDTVPLFLKPDDELIYYKRLLSQFRVGLSVEEQRNEFVKEFIQLLTDIIDNNKRDILKIRLHPMSDSYVLATRSSDYPIPCNDIEENYLIDIAHMVNSLNKIHDASFEVFREQADKTIQLRNMQYQNWFDNGLPMWPQETWLNGLFLNESDAEQPARHQWVLLRPSVGIGSNVNNSISNSKLEATLGLEIAGFAHYLNDDYSNYWGMSLLTTLGDDVGVGYGVLLRYNNYVLGYTKREEDAALGIDDDNGYIFIGYDLYQLLHDKKDGFEGFKRKVRTTIDAYQ